MVDPLEFFLPIVESQQMTIGNNEAIRWPAGVLNTLVDLGILVDAGRTVRPTLVVTDDPQTDESARSLSQCATRESILAGAILGLDGPGKKISGIMPCTVIRPGDMADNILSREKHPEWNGERTRMVYSFPSDEKLWLRYPRELRELVILDDAGQYENQSGDGCYRCKTISPRVMSKIELWLVGAIARRVSWLLGTF